MMKIRPGARFGMAVPIVGEVRLIPWRNRDWNNVTLHTMIPTIYQERKVKLIKQKKGKVEE